MYRLSILPSAALFLLFSIVDLHAQRRPNTYESLLQRTDQPSAYVDHIVIPQNDTSAVFASIFRLEYDFIPFLRTRQDMSPPSPDVEYFSPVRMGLEIFEGPGPENSPRVMRRRSASGRNSGGVSVFRDTWQDTVWVESYEATKSRFDYVQGFVVTTLSGGQYNYELQLSRAGSSREQPSSRRSFEIPDYREAEKAQLFLLDDYDLSQNRFRATLLNYGNNVLYGQDYSVLILLPETVDPDNGNLTLNLHRILSGDNPDSPGEIRYSTEITADDIVYLNGAQFTADEEDNIVMEAGVTEQGVRYAHVPIPNRNFENSRYRLRLEAEGREDFLGERLINSRWIDMPVSLYNLDVAIDMLKFIVSEEQLRRLNSGSSSEREQKFREFWAERDPTPETEFNELMDEYYRRIDHAYEHFTTLQAPGFETDQGRAYIVYGPPLNIERRLPTDAPTREIWEYPNRTLIFEATTGFGDFRLVSESS